MNGIYEIETIYMHCFTAARFTFMFGCLRLLQSEQMDWQKSKAFSYCQNAAYIIVLTHIYTYAQAYSCTIE